MSRTKEIATAAGTLVCALGIGFAMQSTETATKRYGSSGPETEIITPVLPDADVGMPEDPVVMEVQDIRLTSAMPGHDIKISATDLPVRRPVKQAGFLPFPDADVEKPVISEVPCAVEFSAQPADAAFVTLSLNASCLPNERVSIHHSGMVFSLATDDAGRIDVSVPALSESAMFMATIAGQDTVTAKADVPELSDYNRIVLQWEGAAGFELHAREFGAEYGAKGHVWRGSDVGMEHLVAGTGGYLVQLGDRTMGDASLAEVYSFPVNISGGAQSVDLTIEAQVTLANCGLDIDATTLELRPGDTLQSRNVSMSVPGCDTVGDYLVLNNVFEDLKLAAR